MLPLGLREVARLKQSGITGDASEDSNRPGHSVALSYFLTPAILLQAAIILLEAIG